MLEVESEQGQTATGNRLRGRVAHTGRPHSQVEALREGVAFDPDPRESDTHGIAETMLPQDLPDPGADPSGFHEEEGEFALGRLAPERVEAEDLSHFFDDGHAKALDVTGVDGQLGAARPKEAAVVFPMSL